MNIQNGSHIRFLRMEHSKLLHKLILAKKFGRLQDGENSKMTHSHPYIHYSGYAQILLTWHAVFIY